MRIFYLEPFLIKAERHFIETSICINNYLSAHPDFEYYLIGNKKADKRITELLPNIIKGMTQTCFQNLDNKGRSFYEDLINLDKTFSFTTKDLIIVPTSYENQILGTAMFVSLLKHNSPKIALQFHQLFPPVSESDDINKISFRHFWTKRLANAFSQIYFDNVSYWSTESENLNTDLAKISRKHVGVLPVPYSGYAPDSSSKSSKKIKTDQHGLTKLAFLGEGRQEKGLIYFLEAIEIINRQKNNFLFVIQNMNPRGYSQKQQNKFNRILDRVKKYSNVSIIEGGIEPSKFHNIMNWIDCLVLPYNPINYFKRSSGLVVQASIYKKPVIISSNTWGSHALDKKWAAGIVFKYHDVHDNQIVKHLVQAIKNFLLKKAKIKKNAKLYSKHFSTYNTAEEYIKRIIKYYEKT